MTSTPLNLEKAYKHNLLIDKNYPSYKKICKPYRKVDGYLSFKEVAAQLSYLVALGETIEHSDWGRDDTLTANIVCAKLIENESTQVYWVDEKLMQAFLNTNLPTPLIELKKVIPHCILMLPPIIKNPDGIPLNWVFVNYLEDGFERSIDFPSKKIIFVNEDKQRLQWVTTLQAGASYHVMAELYAEGHTSLNSGEISIDCTVNIAQHNSAVELEKRFNDTVTKLVYQSLLFLQARPEDVAEKTLPPITKGVGFGKSGAGTASQLNPIWIGKNYQTKQESAPVLVPIKDEVTDSDRNMIGDRKAYSHHTLSWSTTHH